MKTATSGVNPLRQIGLLLGIAGGLLSLGTVAMTIGVAHYRIAQAETNISGMVPQTWAAEHTRHIHEGAVERRELVTIQTHIESKIARVESDVQRMAEQVQGLSRSAAESQAIMQTILAEVKKN